jgi:uncharacterized protein YdhG (YjbR/CyaY superfamily)
VAYLRLVRREAHRNTKTANESAKTMKPKTIDEYIAGFSPEIQTILQKIRSTIHKTAPDAAERISYGIPTVDIKGGPVHFAAFKNHIGFYPPVRGDAKLMQEMSVYAGEKGNLKFPLAKPIPYALISRIVKARAHESQKRRRPKAKKGK